LPAKGAAKGDFQEVSNIEILLVAGSRIVRRAVEGELNKRGFRVVTVESPIEVFETVIRTRPDMVIASAVMNKISGIDLARALRSMVATRDIPFALLTSFDASHPELRDLPDDIGLVHHDRDINAELDSAVKCLIPAAQ
jgi:PleD family two-component response regulator